MARAEMPQVLVARDVIAQLPLPTGEEPALSLEAFHTLFTAVRALLIELESVESTHPCLLNALLKNQMDIVISALASDKLTPLKDRDGPVHPAFQAFEDKEGALLQPVKTVLSRRVYSLYETAFTALLDHLAAHVARYIKDEHVAAPDAGRGYTLGQFSR